MENKVIRNKKNVNVPFIAFSSVFGALALSAVIVFWVWQDAEWGKVYQMAMRWFMLPLCALVASYAGTIKKAPKGRMWLCPVAFGAVISLVEYLTYSLKDFYISNEMGSFSVVLVIIGALASLFGFTFAKMDRVEKAREARAAEKRAEKEGTEKIEDAKPAIPEYEYSPASDFIPDENDTLAGEVADEDGYGDIEVDCAESDPDFSVDSLDEVVEEAEEALDEHIEDEHVEETIAEEVEEDTEVDEEDVTRDTESGDEEATFEDEVLVDDGESSDNEEVVEEEGSKGVEPESNFDASGEEPEVGEEGVEEITEEEPSLEDENSEE
jgi:hypothetical protein